jgi:hypothetical protein
MHMKKKPHKAGGRGIGHVEVNGGVTTDFRVRSSSVPILSYLCQTLMKLKTNFRRLKIIIINFRHWVVSLFKYALAAVQLPTWNLA